ncbi:MULTISPECIES: hypothetical protein [unclassified Roseofilum]|nr:MULTISPECIES: hypothetical protein [unclassified Roseofilum]
MGLTSETRTPIQCGRWRNQQHNEKFFEGGLSCAQENDRQFVGF